MTTNQQFYLISVRLLLQELDILQYHTNQISLYFLLMYFRFRFLDIPLHIKMSRDSEDIHLHIQYKNLVRYISYSVVHMGDIYRLLNNNHLYIQYNCLVQCI